MYSPSAQGIINGMVWLLFAVGLLVAGFVIFRAIRLALKKNWFPRHPFLTATGAVFLFGVILSLAGGGTTPELVAAAPTAGSERAGKASPAKDGPEVQRDFVTAIAIGRAGYLGTGNELKQHLILRTRDRAVCAAVAGGQVTDWVGRIDALDTVAQGEAVLKVVIGDRVSVSTEGNVVSDFFSETLISMDSAMYATLAELRNGDVIRLSGTFILDHGLCPQERSVTSYGKMKTPNFTFRFTAVTPT